MVLNPARKPRTKPAEERRTDLVISAERLFLKQGIEQTTIEDITVGASVSKGAFYLHFSSKADVVDALRSSFVQGVLDRIKEEVGKYADDNWNGKLRAWANACATSYLDEARLHRLLFAAVSSPPEDGLTRNILIDDLAALLAQGKHENAWALNAPSFTAIFLFNALHGAVSHEGAALDEIARNTLLHELEVHFQRVIG